MSKEQVLDNGIKQKSTKRVNLFIVCSAFCPGPPNRDPMDSEKPLRVDKRGSLANQSGCYSRVQQNNHCATFFTKKKWIEWPIFLEKKQI